jgi:sigma-B regulation protein RsbU (phosphoserine phosphatase)
MPVWRDWKELGRETYRSVTRDDVVGLWREEWRSAREQLVSQHRDEIEVELKRWKRFARSVNAVVFGLTRRLQPVRRLVFALALLLFLFQFDVHVSRQHWSVQIGGGGLVAFLLVTLLLALELVDKIRFRDELELARELQASLLPKTLPELPAWELSAWNRIANMVGGDVYDFVPLPDGRLAVLFGDASGHGMAAGLVMAVAHAGFRTQLETDPSPEAMIPAMNRLLCRAGGPRSFFSCVYILASSDGRLRITVSGHPQVLRTDERGAVLERYGKGSYPLGIRSTLTWPIDESSLLPGEALVLYSDGLTEARNAAEEEFGEDRIEGALRLFAASSSAATLVSELAGAVNRFCGRVPPEDDVSIAVIRRLAAGGIVSST